MRIKLNDKETMSKRNKPTNKDFVTVINGLIQEIQLLKNDMNAFAGTLDFYIEYKHDGPKFKEFIDSKLNIQQKDNNDIQPTGQTDTVANSPNSQN